MAKLIEGSIEWNVQQVKHCIDWALDPSYFGFPNDAASYTMDLYCDRINAQTKLAQSFDWPLMQAMSWQDHSDKPAYIFEAAQSAGFLGSFGNFWNF